MADKTSPEYAMLPAGTIVKWGTVGAAPTAMKALTNCKAVGEMGQTGGFVDCTTLLDTAKQFISDLPEGAEKIHRFHRRSVQRRFRGAAECGGQARNGTVLRRAAERPHFHLHPVAVRLENE